MCISFLVRRYSIILTNLSYILQLIRHFRRKIRYKNCPNNHEVLLILLKLNFELSISLCKLRNGISGKLLKKRVDLVPLLTRFHCIFITQEIQFVHILDPQFLRYIKNCMSRRTRITDHYNIPIHDRICGSEILDYKYFN